MLSRHSMFGLKICHKTILQGRWEEDERSCQNSHHITLQVQANPHCMKFDESNIWVNFSPTKSFTFRPCEGNFSGDQSDKRVD